LQIKGAKKWPATVKLRKKRIIQICLISILNLNISIPYLQNIFWIFAKDSAGIVLEEKILV
jgi:hypothetical protein